MPDKVLYETACDIVDKVRTSDDSIAYLRGFVYAALEHAYNTGRRDESDAVLRRSVDR